MVCQPVSKAKKALEKNKQTHSSVQQQPIKYFAGLLQLFLDPPVGIKTCAHKSFFLLSWPQILFSPLVPQM
jgi:hypothetical protein